MQTKANHDNIRYSVAQLPVCDAFWANLLQKYTSEPLKSEQHSSVNNWPTTYYTSGQEIFLICSRSIITNIIIITIRLLGPVQHKVGIAVTNLLTVSHKTRKT